MNRNKGRKPKKKNIRRPSGAQRQRSGGGPGRVPGHPKATFRTIAPSQAMPKFRAPEKVFRFRFETLASAFKTKTNFTGSQIKGAAAAYGFAIGWSLVDLPAAASLVALFDQFRITKIVLRIAASKNTNTTGTGAIIYIVEDYDNSNLLTSVATAQEYQSCQTIHGSDVGEGEGALITLTPCIPIPSILGNEVKPCPWQDCAVTNNTHYGVKGWYATTAVTDPVWDVDAQYWVEFVNTQ